MKSRFSLDTQRRVYMKRKYGKIVFQLLFPPIHSFFGISPTTLVVKRRDKVALTPFVCAPTTRPPKADYVNEKEEMMAFRSNGEQGSRINYSIVCERLHELRNCAHI